MKGALVTEVNIVYCTILNIVMESLAGVPVGELLACTSIVLGPAVPPTDTVIGLLLPQEVQLPPDSLAQY